ncbi:hypothetical protein EYF80_049996 [Liparis tanakae]|uniref:Uncharacterized protein n=1 Tax=Liparis tanakae TaxID=230148 RepID=A0A4Z2FG10_9TELE|nr:hypothetical protein EYF80_049996 [Liparis tanakae]
MDPYARYFAGAGGDYVGAPGLPTAARFVQEGIDCCVTRRNFQDLLDDDDEEDDKGGPHEKDEGLQDQIQSGGCLSFSGRSK